MSNEGKYCRMECSSVLSHCNLIHLQEPFVHAQIVGLGNFCLKSHLASFP